MQLICIKRTPFHENVCILCKLDENAYIFLHFHAFSWNKFSEIGLSPSKVFVSKDNEETGKLRPQIGKYFSFWRIGLHKVQLR